MVAVVVVAVEALAVLEWFETRERVVVAAVVTVDSLVAEAKIKIWNWANFKGIDLPVLTFNYIKITRTLICLSKESNLEIDRKKLNLLSHTKSDFIKRKRKILVFVPSKIEPIARFLDDNKWLVTEPIVSQLKLTAIKISSQMWPILFFS